MGTLIVIACIVVPFAIGITILVYLARTTKKIIDDIDENFKTE